MIRPIPTAAPEAPPFPLRGEGMGVGGTSPATHALPALEHSLWRAETRFDRALMEATFAPDFHEFGRSGRRYTRDEMLFDAKDAEEIDATLHDLKVTDLAPGLALVTYISEVRYDPAEWANRASIWDRSSGRWQLRFHQGTPCKALT
jgi:hypothetical protein